MADTALPTDMDFADIRAALGQTPAPTEKAPAEAAPPAEVDEKVETPEAPPAEAQADEPPAPPAPDKREKRFSKITAERDAERAARVALEARLAALEAGSKAPAPQAPPAPAADTKPVKPSIDSFEGPDAWAKYSQALEQYEEKVTDWKVAQALAKKAQEAVAAKAKAEYEKVHNGWLKQVEELTEDNDDIEDAIKTVGNSVAKKGIIDVIKESEVGAKMVLYLHRNPAELAKVESMSIASAARYLGKIEARIEGEAAPAAAATKAPAKPLPKPPAQLGGAPSSTAKGFDYQNASEAELKAQLRREGWRL